MNFQNTDNQYAYSPEIVAYFTGKEKDSETGFSYFGARYLDHDLTTLWLSVDPMSDKYPSISPYAYCAWNPVKLVDPDGEYIWKPEMLKDGTVNYVREYGDNAKTLQKQYNLSETSAMLLYSSMKSGKISGASVKKITGNEVLKLNVRNCSNSRFLFHLGFYLMYNCEKQGCGEMKLNDCFSGMPQDLGANCKWGTPRYLDDFGIAIFGQKTESYSIPVKGGGEIPVTFFSSYVPGNARIIRDCYGIQEKKSGYYNLKINYFDGTRCNGTTAIIIQVPAKYEATFKESYE